MKKFVAWLKKPIKPRQNWTLLVVFVANATAGYINTRKAEEVNRRLDVLERHIRVQRRR